MDCRLQNVEQQLFKVDDLQETILGFREEMQMMGRSFRQELQTITQELRGFVQGAPHRNGAPRGNDHFDDRRRTQLPRMEFPRHEKPTTELTHLRQTATLAEFNVQFDTIAAKLDLAEEYLVDVYVGALKDEIADSVRMFDPQTLVEARRLARVQEIAVNHRNAKAINERTGKQMSGPPTAVTSLTPYKNALLKGGSSLRASETPSVVNEPGYGPKNAARFVRPIKMLTAWEEAEHCEGVCAMATTTQLEQNSRNAVDKSQGCVPTSMLVIAIPLVPLSSFSSLLSLFQSLEQRALQKEDTAQPSKNTVQPAEGAWKFTWMQKSQFERSNLQLASIFVGLQQYFQDYVGICNYQWAYGFGYGSKEDSPMPWQLSFTNPLAVIKCGLFQKWASLLNFSPTRILMLEWFKGELITMLFGRVCSLSRKKRKK